jgi:RsiW-degrading membrane proteinase PrsW (M82 family)
MTGTMTYTPANIFFFSIAAAAIPALVYVSVIYWFDRYEKEPTWLLAATFFWGAIPSIALALLFSLAASVPLYLFTGPDTGDTLNAIVAAPPIEESVKGLALLAIFFLMRHEIDSLLDGIIYGAMVGMGFAVVENVLYFVQVYNESGIAAWQSNVFLRAVLFGLNHSLFSAMTGLGLAVARLSTNRALRIAAPIFGWSVAVGLHMVHNLGATMGGVLCFLLPLTDWGGIFLLGGIVLWALLQERRWIQAYLAEEVTLGTLSREQYLIACSGRSRLRRRLALLRSGGLRAYLRAARFYRLCSELAYKKHHFHLLQEAESERLTAELRLSVARLSRELASPVSTPE